MLLAFRFSPGLGSFLSPLPLFPFPHRHQRPQACVSTGRIKVTRLKTAAKAVNAKLPHTCAKKKHELKDEKLYRHRLVARDPIHIAELRQCFGAHTFGQTWVHQGKRKAFYS